MDADAPGLNARETALLRLRRRMDETIGGRFVGELIRAGDVAPGRAIEILESRDAPRPPLRRLPWTNGRDDWTDSHLHCPRQRY